MLGGSIQGTLDNSGDLNNCLNPGIYCVHATVTNAPIGGAAMRGLLIVYKYTRDSNVYYAQIFTVAGSSVTWIRSYYINWSAWQQFSTDVPDFYKNYSTLDEFVAASLETTNSVSSYTDFNSITTSGQYVFLSTQITGKEHAPSESSGCLLVLGGSMIRQIYFENSAENKVFIRKNFASQGWSAWVRL